MRLVLLALASSALALFVGAGLGPSTVHARRAAQEPAGDAAAEAIAPDGYFAPRPGAGAPVMIRPPHPPPVVTQAQLRATLARARPDLQACLPPGTWRGTVRATLSARRGLSLAVSVTPRDAAVRACLDTAARRWLIPLEGRNLAGTITASVQVRSSGPPPPPVPPVNPPPPNNSYDEGMVHARLDVQRNEILRCLPTASASTPGDITLRLSVRTDGTLVLEGATLPSGIGGGPVLSCLSGVVGRTRVPSPPTTRSVTHIVTLGR